MPDYGVYATVEEVKEYLVGTQEANFHPKDDQRIAKFCVQASRTFDAECNRVFYPRIQTRYYDHPGTQSGNPYSAFPFYQPVTNQSPYPNVATRVVDLSTLLLDDDLLAVNSLTTANGTDTITSNNYYLMTGNDYNYPPYDRISLKLDGSQTVFYFSGTPQKCNAVTGLWGYHEKYNGAWQQIDTVQSNITSSATTVTVSDIDGVDEQGFTPRFQFQQLCRFGNTDTSEMFYVIGKSPETNILDIIRGVNGTTATAQTSTTPIYVYRPMDEIKLALLVLSTYAYRRKDNVGRNEVDNPIATASGVVIMPPQLPTEVKMMIGKYKRSPYGNQSL